MTLHTWWLFVMMSFVVSGTPGPNMLLVMSSSARHGARPALAAMAGCMTALMLMMCLSAAGLGALLQASPAVFDVLRWAGAAYLVYLGVKSWRAPTATGADNAPALPSERGAALFRRGFLVAASNPKAILFAAAFLPQFITMSAPRLPQFAILLVTFALIEGGWYMAYAAGGQRIAVYLRRTPVLRLFNRVTGGVFVGFGALMAALRH
ncbi:LysE family translocator [Noviherbaspirillum soli]|uniref:LysE family translocator n=1 Tax=Noviherbaspirillum soli TaxID=1064518 RepID=UPI00188A8ECE|nr:LysE family translocator [Noviherbaspirillum soli]